MVGIGSKCSLIAGVYYLLPALETRISTLSSGSYLQEELVTALLGPTTTSP